MYRVVIGQAGVGDFALRSFLPTLRGNSVGGVALVAALDHAAQVVTDRRATA